MLGVHKHSYKKTLTISPANDFDVFKRMYKYKGLLHDF
jgi:hypothetical protein